MPAAAHNERLLRVSGGMVAAVNGEHPARDLCRACVETLAVAGASVMVMTEGPHPAPFCSSNAVSARIEDLQHTLGEGPCVDAHEGGRAVSEPDLAMPRRPRWIAFAPAAVAAGAKALFSFPLRVGGVRLGALTLYQPRAGELSAGQHADAHTMASVVANAILAIQGEAAPGTLSPDLEVLAGHRAEFHQASGMVSVQLGLGVGEAMVRLRAYAYATERPLAEIAVDVVARRLRFAD